MSQGDESIRTLRDAVQHSPDNIPLRRHLAQSLMGLGRYEEAEHELRDALALAPQSVEVKLALAQAYYQQGKNSQALVIVEDIAKHASAPAAARALYARLLVRSGDVPNAVAQYKLALES